MNSNKKSLEERINNKQLLAKVVLLNPNQHSLELIHKVAPASSVQNRTPNKTHLLV